MITQELLDYIKGQQAEGVGKEAITQTLLSHDWSRTDIEEAFNTLEPETPQIPKEMPEPAITEDTTIVTEHTPQKKNIGKTILIILALLVILVLSTLIFFDYQGIDITSYFRSY